jgi:hypothetical protein
MVLKRRQMAGGRRENIITIFYLAQIVCLLNFLSICLSTPGFFWLTPREK